MKKISARGSAGNYQGPPCWTPLARIGFCGCWLSKGISGAKGPFFVYYDGASVFCLTWVINGMIHEHLLGVGERKLLQAKTAFFLVLVFFFF
jgi:hypothetical protein